MSDQEEYVGPGPEDFGGEDYPPPAVPEIRHTETIDTGDEERLPEVMTRVREQLAAAGVEVRPAEFLREAVQDDKGPPAPPPADAIYRAHAIADAVDIVNEITDGVIARYALDNALTRAHAAQILVRAGRTYLHAQANYKANTAKRERAARRNAKAKRKPKARKPAKRTRKGR